MNPMGGTRSRSPCTAFCSYLKGKSMQKDYVTVKAYAEDEFVEKKSRFIGCIQPVETVEEAERFLASVRKKHPEAGHHVYAYVLKDGLTRRCSDDGEPQGTGGVPVLDVIQKEGIVGVCIVVTRYFGGILLGVGGLTRAYSKGARIALAAAEKMHMTTCHVLNVCCDYGFYGKISYLLPQYKIQTLDTSFTDSVEMLLLIRADRTEAFTKELTELSAGKVLPDLVEERFHDME